MLVHSLIVFCWWNRLFTCKVFVYRFCYFYCILNVSVINNAPDIFFICSYFVGYLLMFFSVIVLNGILHNNFTVCSLSILIPLFFFYRLSVLVFFSNYNKAAFFNLYGFSVIFVLSLTNNLLIVNLLVRVSYLIIHIVFVLRHIRFFRLFSLSILGRYNVCLCHIWLVIICFRNCCFFYYFVTVAIHKSRCCKACYNQCYCKYNSKYFFLPIFHNKKPPSTCILMFLLLILVIHCY